MRAYFHGNPVCKTDVSMRHSFSCEEMCSKYCEYRSNEVDQAVDGCDAGCNMKDCNYDQAGCAKSLSMYRQWTFVFHVIMIIFLSKKYAKK